MTKDEVISWVPVLVVAAIDYRVAVALVLCKAVYRRIMYGYWWSGYFHQGWDF